MSGLLSSPNSRAAEAILRKLGPRVVHGGINRAAERLEWHPARAYRQLECVAGNPAHLSLFLELLQEAPDSCVRAIGEEVFGPLGFAIVPKPEPGGDTSAVHQTFGSLLSALGKFETDFGSALADDELDESERLELLADLGQAENRIRALRAALGDGRPA